MISLSKRSLIWGDPIAFLIIFSFMSLFTKQLSLHLVYTQALVATTTAYVGAAAPICITDQEGDEGDALLSSSRWDCRFPSRSWMSGFNVLSANEQQCHPCNRNHKQQGLLQRSGEDCSPTGTRNHKTPSLFMAMPTTTDIDPGETLFAICLVAIQPIFSSDLWTLLLEMLLMVFSKVYSLLHTYGRQGLNLC